MTEQNDCRLFGRRCITGSDFWDGAYLDLFAPAQVSFEATGRGEFAFGALEARMTLEYGRTIVLFRFEAFDCRIAARTACVVVALRCSLCPMRCRTCPIPLASSQEITLRQHTPGLNS